MSEQGRAALRVLFTTLADIYSAEGRPGGDAVAEAYRRGAADPPVVDIAVPYRLDAVIRAALSGAAIPAAVAARAAHPWLPWTATGILEDQIPTAVSDMFAVVSLVGPDAMVRAEGVRSGLFVQRPAAYYQLHAHAAEETYVMLAGSGEWTLEGNLPVEREAGDYIHHPPNAGHATRTGTLPLLAAWRWSGEIGSESYRFLEDTG